MYALNGVVFKSSNYRVERMHGQWWWVNYKTKHPLHLAERALQRLYIVVTNSLVWAIDWRAILNLKEMYNFCLSTFTIYINNAVYHREGSLVSGNRVYLHALHLHGSLDNFT